MFVPGSFQLSDFQLKDAHSTPYPSRTAPSQLFWKSFIASSAEA